MFFQIIGFVFSSLLAGFFLLYKLTGDLYPRALKKFLYSQAIHNWQKGLTQKLYQYDIVNATKTTDTGIVVVPEDKQLEAPKNIQNSNEGDDILFYGIDDNGNGLVIKLTRFYHDVAEATVYLNFQGRQYNAICTGASPSHDALEFSVGNLKLEIVEAMRTWRLWFNGIMSEESGDGSSEEGKQVHVTLNILWKPLDWPKDSQKDANLNLLSEQLASSGKFGQSLFQLPNILPNGYSQFGVFHGQVNLDGLTDEKERQIYLYGSRIRQFLTLTQNHQAENENLELFAMCGCTGQALRLSANNGVWVEGTTAHQSCATYPALSVDAEPENFKTIHTLPKFFSVQDKNETHRVEVWPSFRTKILPNLEIIHLTLTISGDKSRGLLVRTLNTKEVSEAVLQKQARKERQLLSSKNQQQAKIPNRELRNEAIDSQSQDFVSLESTSCLNVKLVGGKGASLAALVKFVTEKDLSGDIKTSQGFCVTTSFFKRILDLDNFASIFGTVTSDDELNETCDKVKNLILNTGKEDEIEQLVSVWINRTFVECNKDGKFSHLKADRFAVRSSGTLEDAADISCAGQNETFLGVKEENVTRKIIECWASLFSFQSVRYRLNHGQPAVSDMGVVVQAMVNATAAGVIFTADPITGNPFEMLVNANYGLGESVVSATCDPDTIRIVRSRDANQSLSIGTKTIGKKTSKIVVNEQGVGATHEIVLTEDEKTSCCIPDRVALNLAQIALQLVAANDEKPLDIEWAIDGNHLYILQSRNITSLDSWTDFEIIHEHDTPLRTQFERLTNANTGEVMPGATSTLGLSLVTKILDVAIQGMNAKRIKHDIPNPYIVKDCAIARKRLLLNILQILYRNNEPEIQPVSLAIDLSLFGHSVMNKELHQLAIKRWGIDSGRKKLMNLVQMIYLLGTSSRTTRKAEKMYSNYVMKFDDVAENPKALYDRITETVFDGIGICTYHCGMSEASGCSQIFAFLFLSEGRKVEDWDTNLYTDVSKILSVCKDVESADIPNAMDKLAQLIIDEGEAAVESVTNGTSPEAALSFIQNHPRLNQGYNEFLDKHGHRGIFELDLMRQSWKTEPSSFIVLLQSIVSSKSKFKDTWKSSAKEQYSNDDALLDSLQTKIKGSTRKVLKFILPYCRSSVYNRERTKSLMVNIVNQLKLGFNRLGELLVRDQLISDAKLIYHFTHDEVKQLMNRSPNSSRILYKAMRRQKLHTMLQAEEFNEISIGNPEPIDKSLPVELGDTITATPVSSGRIQGIVKVCHSVEDASNLIQPGDILVTHSTDIGWSPFFPILGGVVTELGGLISHGAVVAREYGLPCIVGATHATKIFRTGDSVILDASKGTLSKVKITTD